MTFACNFKQTKLRADKIRAQFVYINTYYCVCEVPPEEVGEDDESVEDSLGLSPCDVELPDEVGLSEEDDDVSEDEDEEPEVSDDVPDVSEEPEELSSDDDGEGSDGEDDGVSLGVVITESCEDVSDELDEDVLPPL